MKKYLILFLILVLCGCSKTTKTTSKYEYNSLYPEHEAYGDAVGLNPGRVVWIHDIFSVDWNGEGNWWNPENFNEDVITEMINRGISATRF